MVLNTLLETNNIRNSPAYILSQEAQAAANPNFVSGMSFNDSSSQGGGGSDYFVIDAERVVETKCADRVHSIIACALEAFYVGHFLLKKCSN
jgi:hypothetical protein